MSVNPSPEPERNQHTRRAQPTRARSISPDELAEALRWVRWSMGIMWIATGLVSLGIYPVADSYALLQRAGVPSMLAPLALYGAVALDIVLGALCFARTRHRYLWVAQAVLILVYTLIITVKLPEFWLHPYGPILKNLPLLAILWLLYRAEPIRPARRPRS